MTILDGSYHSGFVWPWYINKKMILLTIWHENK